MVSFLNVFVRDQIFIQIFLLALLERGALLVEDICAVFLVKEKF